MLTAICITLTCIIAASTGDWFAACTEINEQHLREVLWKLLQRQI